MFQRDNSHSVQQDRHTCLPLYSYCAYYVLNYHGTISHRYATKLNSLAKYKIQNTYVNTQSDGTNAKNNYVK